MPSSKQFRDAAVARLMLFGPVAARAMFGGYGLYMEGIMFALIAHDTLYFKADDENRDVFLAAGSTPFMYGGKNGPVQMSYYQVPTVIFEDTEQLAVWVEKAHAAARRAAAKKKPRRSRQM